MAAGNACENFLPLAIQKSLKKQTNKPKKHVKNALKVDHLDAC